MKMEQEVRATWDEFARRNGTAVGFEDEQAIINAAHGLRDRAVVQGLVAAQDMHKELMHAVMDGSAYGNVAELVHLVSSRRVVVHDDPDAVLERPFAAEAFSLHPGTVYGLVDRWLSQADEIGLNEVPVYALHDSGDVGERGRSTYDWVPIDVSNKRDVAGSVLVLVHPALAGYDPDLGFLADRSTGYRARLAPAQVVGARPEYGYQLESYGEHVRRVLHAMVSVAWPELACAAGRLEQVFGWPSRVIEQAAHLVAVLHDLGKLNQAWQRWVVDYQAGIGCPVGRGFYAHTYYDPANAAHRERQRATLRKPSHAVEGATAAAPLLAAVFQGCEPVFNAAFTAIARHHGAFVRQGHRYALASGAREAVADTLTMMPGDLAAGADPASIWTNEDPREDLVADLLVNPARDAEFLAYVLLARALRRADQAGTAQATAREEVALD